MTKNTFIDRIKDNYFEQQTIQMEELKKMLKEIMPVEGYVDSEILVEEDGNITLALRDYYNEDKWDAADLLCKLTINSEKIIEVVEHDIPSYVNFKNKNIVLFLSSIVGKKLNYQDESGYMSPVDATKLIE